MPEIRSCDEYFMFASITIPEANSNKNVKEVQKYRRVGKQNATLKESETNSGVFSKLKILRTYSFTNNIVLNVKACHSSKLFVKGL